MIRYLTDIRILESRLSGKITIIPTCSLVKRKKRVTVHSFIVKKSNLRVFGGQMLVGGGGGAGRRGSPYGSTS